MEKKKEIPDGPNLKELRQAIKNLNKATSVKEKRATKLVNRNKMAGKNLKSNIKVAKAMTSELSGLIEGCENGKNPDYNGDGAILDAVIPDMVDKIIGDVTKIFVTYDYFWYSKPPS